MNLEQPARPALRDFPRFYEVINYFSSGRRLHHFFDKTSFSGADQKAKLMVSLFVLNIDSSIKKEKKPLKDQEAATFIIL
jgi:hypothetical protein